MTRPVHEPVRYDVVQIPQQQIRVTSRLGPARGQSWEYSPGTPVFDGPGHLIHANQYRSFFVQTKKTGSTVTSSDTSGTHDNQQGGVLDPFRISETNHCLVDVNSSEPTELENIANLAQQAIVFTLFVEGIEVAAMLDNGANITVMSTRLAKLLRDRGKAKTYAAQATVTVFGGPRVTMTAKMDLNIGTETRTAKIDVWVSGEVPFDLCVGFNFTRPNKFVIDLDKGSITMFGKEHGETVVMMNNTQILGKLSQMAQAIRMQNFHCVPTLSTAQ